MAKCVPSYSTNEALRKLEEQLTCPVCLDRFDHPKTLPCLHSFCLRCIQQFPLAVQEAGHLISCPTCRHSTPLPDQGPDNFPPAFLINNFLDLYKMLQKVSGSNQISCDSCHLRDAVSHCRQCSVFLCQSCVEHHKALGFFSSHQLTGVEDVAAIAAQLIPLKEQPIMKCHAHDKPLEIFCETCDELICQHCTIKLHRDHDYDLVNDVFSKHKQQIEDDLQPVKQQVSIITAVIAALDKRADQISVQGEEVKQKIHDTTQQSIEALQRSEKQESAKVDIVVHQKRQILVEVKKVAATMLAQLTSCQEFVEEEMRIGSKEQVLSDKHQMLERMKAVSSQARSSNLQAVEEANISFTANKELLPQCNKLGEVKYSTIASRMIVKGKVTEVTRVGQKISFELSTSSSPSVPLPINLLFCQLTAPNSSKPVDCTITPTQLGSYSVQYTPIACGLHQLRITVGGTDIPNSPFTINVRPSLHTMDRPLHTITELNRPWGVVVSESGEMMVTEYYGHRVTVFNKDRKKIQSFGSKGTGDGQFTTPRGIAFTRDGLLIVCDGNNHRLQVFTKEGLFVRTVGQKGNGPVQFSTPRDIAIHPSGKLFIVDSDNHRIQVLNTDMTFSHKFGSYGSGQGQLSKPFSVACDTHGNAYVVDFNNHRVVKFTAEGDYLSSFGSKGSREGCFNNPGGICIEISDTLFVSDNYRVSVFTSSGQFLKHLGSEGEDNLKYPYGLAVDNSGHLYVCGNDRIVIYNITIDLL